MERATGSTTILFTDIEGSTRLWEREPARMSRALAGHDAVLRAAVEQHGGTVVKMLGDGMYAAFVDPVDGLNATVALQRSLEDAQATGGVPLRVRCGLHRGHVEHRDGDYFGASVNRTARIMSAAHGGQILLSQALVDGLGANVPSEATLRDLGSVRLKDLAEPEHVYQLVHPALRSDFPALRSLESTPNNLPHQLTSFIGREREIGEVAAQLRESRLVTLAGMGGLGKTRLSLQVAAEALDRFPDGVWFLDLAPIRDGSLVASVCAQALGLQEEPGRPLVQTIVGHLRNLASLLILDNCEHLVASCADFANALLRGAPTLRILATSREALRVPGEQIYPLLPFAPPERTSDVGALVRSDAVQLFVDRARLHEPTFALQERDAAVVAELCARLDGIPLAIELAAARVRTLSIADIDRRLRDRFKLLTGGGRVLLERQQTLRALVDWSYDLLGDDERVLFDRLCVFAGGFDLAACEAVCGMPPLDADDVVDRLASLVDKSLVMVQHDDRTARYRTLETIRDYARERLIARGELEAAAARHCEHFLALAKSANLGLKGPEQGAWLRRLEAERDNLRAAISLALEQRVDPVISVKLEVALQSFWILRGYASEGRRYVRASLAIDAVRASDVAHAHALYVGAGLASISSDDEDAKRLLESCLELRRRIGNPVDLAATLSTLALVRLNAGDAAGAREGEEEALAIFRDVGDRIGEVIGLLHLGAASAHLGERDRAREECERALAIATAVEYAEGISEAERMLGEIALESGDAALARARFERSLAVSEASHDRRDAATAQWWLGRVDLHVREHANAAARFATALDAFESLEMPGELLSCIEDVSALMQGVARSREAGLLIGAADAQRARSRLRQTPQRAARWLALGDATRAALGDDAFEAARAEGAAWEAAESVRRARGWAAECRDAPGGTAALSASPCAAN